MNNRLAKARSKLRVLQAELRYYGKGYEAIQQGSSQAQTYFNPVFIYTNRGAPNFVDFFSVIAHESGHGLGLAHFGKLFVTKKAAADGIQSPTSSSRPKH